MLAEDPFRTLRPELPAFSAKERDTPLAEAAPALVVSAAKTRTTEPLSLRELEIQHIERLLKEHRNITMVAKLLDIDRRTLQRKLRALGIDWREE
jgi:ActR/RegA family two-component response regulator